MRQRIDAQATGKPSGRVPGLLALYACWGTAIPAMKIMVETVPPLLGAAMIFLSAGIIFLALSRKRRCPTTSQVLKMALAGLLLLVGGQGLAMVALTEVSSSLGAILVSAIPLWVVILGALTGSRISGWSVMRLIAGFCGIALVILTAPERSIGGAPWAVAVFCVAPILWAAGSLLSARTKMPVDPVVASAVQLLAGGSGLLLLGLAVGEVGLANLQGVSAGSAMAAAYLLLFDSLLGFLLYTWLLRSTAPALVNTYAYVTPVIAVTIGVTILDEPLWTGAVLGGLLVILSVAGEMRARDSEAGGLDRSQVESTRESRSRM